MRAAVAKALGSHSLDLKDLGPLPPLARSFLLGLLQKSYTYCVIDRTRQEAEFACLSVSDEQKNSVSPFVQAFVPFQALSSAPVSSSIPHVDIIADSTLHTVSFANIPFASNTPG